MRQAVLNINDQTLKEFGFDVFQDVGLLDINILSCEGSRGVTRIHVERQPDERQLEEIDTIQWWEQVSNEESEYVYIVEMDVAEQLDSIGIDADRVLRAERAKIQNRGVSVDQAGSQDQISAMLSDMKAAGFEISLEKLRDYRVRETALDALTDRQREVLYVAYELGYYDVPRGASMSEIAEEHGVDDSTVAEHLQRAEHNLLEALLD